MKTLHAVLSLAFATSVLNAEAADLAKKPANPIAALISVPVHGNFDFGVGPAHRPARLKHRPMAPKVNSPIPLSPIDHNNPRP